MLFIGRTRSRRAGVLKVVPRKWPPAFPLIAIANTERANWGPKPFPILKIQLRRLDWALS
ncbi:hypothetical protein B7486_03620 [cyanobacterium TDX16]|nr:hypothetical protein B7486_03620 [cyanobacterium TDX16]